MFGAQRISKRPDAISADCGITTSGILTEMPEGDTIHPAARVSARAHGRTPMEFSHHIRVTASFESIGHPLSHGG